MELARQQSTCDKVRKNTLAHISRHPEDELKEEEEEDSTSSGICRTEIEDNRTNERKLNDIEEDENNQLIIQRLETSLADIIDSAVLNNLKINGNILSDQFDAIIATLKKVAASVDSGGSDSPHFVRRNSDLVGFVLIDESHEPLDAQDPALQDAPVLVFHQRCHPGHTGTPPLIPKNRKLSLPRDNLQDNSPSLGELARRLHANPNHLRADQDYVDFIDLDQPYVSPVPQGVSASDLIRGGPTPKAYGRKNSTGSLGLSSCASLLEDKAYYAGGPSITASVTNLNAAEDYGNVFGPQQNTFRKVHSTSNVNNGSSAGGPHRLFQRHLSLSGPDDQGEHRLRKSLSKSRELLSQLENEYKKIKGDENKNARNSIVIDQSWLDQDFDELLQTLSNDKTIQADPHEALAFLTNNNNNNTTPTTATSTSTASLAVPSSTSSSSGRKVSKKDMPPLPSDHSPRVRRHHHQGQAASEGRHIFSFFQKKGRSQSLSGTEAIKITLPVTREDDFRGVPRSAHHQQEGIAAPHGGGGVRRVTYEKATTMERPAGRSNRSNSIPSEVPPTSNGSALPLDLVGILKKTRSKSLSKAAFKESHEDPFLEEENPYQADNGEERPSGGGEHDGEDEPARQMRSLSLPKSFLSDRYGLTGFKAALPSVIFPWRRGDPNRSSGRSSPAPPSDSVSQSAAAPPPYYNQSAAAVPEEALNGTCPGAPHDARQHQQQQKDSSVWRRSRVGSGGVSRSTRKEKASSSPVFRRASLSHSEWDIRRPWSHVYSEREAAKLSQSVCRLAMTSAEDGVASEVMTRVGEEGPRSLPYMPSPNNSSSEGVFQKFKKSLSLRLAKKGSRSESPSSHSAPVSHCPPEPTAQIESQTLPRRRGSINREEDNKSSFLFGHPLFRSSKERRRARLKDARSSKCNSGDSGDSGIELVTGSGHVTALDMTSSQPAEVDANNYLDPAFVASFADDGSGPRELNPRAVRRTHSDVGGVTGRGSLHYSRQLSTPQPIKLRPAHRLPQHTGSLGKSKSLKRSKASSHLRRSISQPLDLDKAYDTPISTLRKCRSPSNAQNRRQRRPSAGNILNDDNTTSEDEIGMSDSEDFRPT
ncbi:uncharacterized protein LOC135213776 [Macrobrachium nipponense]|uniref:uncharacterized protein LOC135213776 n=1 Tax=Macrobrachium nipponense TaxID=159736 RepID=UPI0030C80D0E